MKTGYDDGKKDRVSVMKDRIIITMRALEIMPKYVEETSHADIKAGIRMELNERHNLCS